MADEVGFLVEDIADLAPLSSSSFSFVKRDGNVVAHSLKHCNLTLSNSVTWFIEPPHCIVDHFMADLVPALKTSWFSPKKIKNYFTNAWMRYIIIWIILQPHTYKKEKKKRKKEAIMRGKRDP